MKLFDSVVIACDNSPDTFKDANAIRTSLEAFGLRVHLYHLIQKRDALAFLTGTMPPCEYVVLLCHGGRGLDGTEQINLRTIDQAEGDYQKSAGWESVTLSLTPANIPDQINGMGRTLICDACGSGRESFARAFLQAGYKAYIAPRDGGVRGSAMILFIIGFFYHLLAATRLDDEPLYHTDQEAVALAAQMDADFTHGTRLFHYYSE